MTYRPTLSTPSSTCSKPPSTTMAKASPTVDAWVVSTTAMVIVMGPVGPEIWVRVPPKTAAKKPTPIAP